MGYFDPASLKYSGARNMITLIELDKTCILGKGNHEVYFTKNIINEVYTWVLKSTDG